MPSLQIPTNYFSPAAWTRLVREYPVALALLAIVFCIGCLGLVFIEITDEVLERESDAIDRTVLMWLRPDDPPRWLLELARDITALGSTVVLTMWVAVTALFLLFSRCVRACVFVAAAAGTGMLMSTALKMAFNRDRPDVIDHGLYVATASFPSGHAMLSAVVYLTLGALISELVRPAWQKLYIVAVAAFLTGIVGFSRLYLGVHWPTDVLAGWAAGAAWAMGAWGLARFVFKPDSPMRR